MIGGITEERKEEILGIKLYQAHADAILEYNTFSIRAFLYEQELSFTEYEYMIRCSSFNINSIDLKDALLQTADSVKENLLQELKK